MSLIPSNTDVSPLLLGFGVRCRISDQRVHRIFPWPSVTLSSHARADSSQFHHPFLISDFKKDGKAFRPLRLTIAGYLSPLECDSNRTFPGHLIIRFMRIEHSSWQTFRQVPGVPQVIWNLGSSIGPPRHLGQRPGLVNRLRFVKTYPHVKHWKGKVTSFFCCEETERATCSRCSGISFSRICRIFDNSRIP